MKKTLYLNIYRGANHKVRDQAFDTPCHPGNVFWPDYAQARAAGLHALDNPSRHLYLRTVPVEVDV